MRFKVCCIQSLSEARLAAAYGATALGLVGPMPSGPGVLTEAAIARIVGEIRAAGMGLELFLLTSETRAERMAAQWERCARPGVIQMTAWPEDGCWPRLRAATDTKCRLIQVIHVRDDSSLVEARRASPWVDGLLLDSGQPTAATPMLGGTGRVHDWAVSARLVKAVSPLPVWLAGGLTPDNAAQAIKAVQPFGLDVCSGLRVHGVLDEMRLRAFAQVVHAPAQ